jgi:hypothetical protein
MKHCSTTDAGSLTPAFEALLTDEEVAAILVVAIDWVRAHAEEIPGLQRLGMYSVQEAAEAYRFWGD